MRLTIFYLIHHKIPIINHSMNCPSKADDVKNRRQSSFFYNPTKFFFRISSPVQKDKTSPIKWHESNHAWY